MSTLPLLAHDSPSAVAAYRGGVAISARQLLADVVRLAESLPPGRYVLNACTDRYRFAVALLAAIVSDKVTLLPPTYVPDVVRQLRAFAPDAVCIGDDDSSELDLPLVRCPTDFAPLPTEWNVPQVDIRQTVAYVFTSGSTGVPVPHIKTWGRLCDNVRVEAERLGLRDRRGYALLATVPPQHMFGFESSVLLALCTGQAFAAERPFYPADVVSVLGRLPRPRILVSTPVHLRALLAAGVSAAVDLVVCATAPLDPEIARDVEARFGAPLLEIYGSTETGQIASRRTVEAVQWSLWPGVELEERSGRVWARGGHIETPTALGDIIEPIGVDRFLLHGRTADLVNVAGKRSSLAYLNHVLTTLPGVADGIFFVREDVDGHSATGTSRLAAVAVAPGLSSEDLLRLLRERVDPVFLPRPLLLVDRIPRNATGKLPRAVLESLVARR